jgi:dinuclear metal center YbgI/SA1388 family protein
MKLLELCSYLESIAPLGLQESYDNSGLILGPGDMEITGVMCSLDCTLDVLVDAKEKNCNVVVSHHPIIFSGIKKFNEQHYVEKAIIYAIRNHIAIYAIHTNLDNVLYNGVNEKIAKRLDLEELRILSVKPGSVDTGAGIVGRLKQPVATVDFMNMLKIRLKTPVVRHTRLVKDTIQHVALAGGSGAFLIPSALKENVDIYITADLKYHEFFDADDRMILMDIGHYESEQFTIELLYELISQKFSNFATHYTKISTNPVHYF